MLSVLHRVGVLLVGLSAGVELARWAIPVGGSAVHIDQIDGAQEGEQRLLVGRAPPVDAHHGVAGAAGQVFR